MLIDFGFFRDRVASAFNLKLSTVLIRDEKTRAVVTSVRDLNDGETYTVSGTDRVSLWTEMKAAFWRGWYLAEEEARASTSSSSVTSQERDGLLPSRGRNLPTEPQVGCFSFVLSPDRQKASASPGSVEECGTASSSESVVEHALPDSGKYGCDGEGRAEKDASDSWTDCTGEGLWKRRR
uniref:Uncharacterized protein n=1 Tax=Chromera velia CCMP2878 TaxID=1169474 RepID=A0A0G4HH72_9ALVE|mmetsp:Transcript_1483/g.3090  ORF Transcript_1483/g.3090 Transcript_1483/m.3090 type:complete len:180 (+) Transcript_1483:1289-1828(+)|eukprot:Cvel_27562.t1-p1 / transcript=Cvel_27562.t1 / gene=Cvel_27562 / organism=Chromera_velia_CCMP2878 / gene_product=hypothetical protein / transcript_product=hypothetical protein / location=Cvel_scaffold3462:8841-9815(-) / protein_length=179 / sequence_SO=supercontig / SO=protein_coding / is_pseudo=false